MSRATSHGVQAGSEPPTRQSVPNDEAKYWLPAEAGPHEATILAFPSQNSLPREQINGFRAEVIEIATAVSEFEPVRLYARPDETNIARAMMTARSPNNINVVVIPFPVVHPWVRDTGPLYVFEQNNGTGECDGGSRGVRRFAVDFNFNEWGGKIPLPGNNTPILSDTELRDNAKFAERVIASDCEPSPVTRVATKLVLEGGGIEVDGEGTLLLIHSAVLNDNRNPETSPGEICNMLSSLFGVTNIIGLGGVRRLYRTDCHIDSMVRFARPGVVVVSRPHANEGDEWVVVAENAIQVLLNSTDTKGRPFSVHVLYEPDPISLVSHDGGEITPSYANFYLANGGVIIPAFGDEKADAAAAELFKKLYPDRKVVQIGIHAIAAVGGGIHCVTQQVPKFVSDAMLLS